MWNIILKLKFKFYQLRVWLKLIFIYRKIDLTKVDYDTYWKNKRAKGIGGLSDWQKERADIILKNIEENSSVLDIGCGDGSILVYLKDKIKFSNLFGADSSSYALDKAKESGIVGYKIDISNIDSLKSLPDVDYIFLLEILEHIPNPEEVLNILYSKAKKGIFFSFPNSGFIIYRLRLLFGSMPMQWTLHPSEHLRFWTYRDLKWWLKELNYFNKSKIFFYKGFAPFRKIYPGLFAPAFVVKIKKI